MKTCEILNIIYFWWIIFHIKGDVKTVPRWLTKSINQNIRENHFITTGHFFLNGYTNVEWVPRSSFYLWCSIVSHTKTYENVRKLVSYFFFFIVFHYRHCIIFRLVIIVWSTSDYILFNLSFQMIEKKLLFLCYEFQ